ncbi:TetR/AcrR family transcriptional regulator [Fontimonas sp. SYSU GA230001]|uniref:TetR/AcrR family transcriptional regulator n=1 Tax=Fontimonas sp. SYSU GA230001 TaxID=3142450 RepID=UPI0032B40652
MRPPVSAKSRPRPRVGRPPRSAQRSAEVRARVIEVARALFAADGFEAVSMRRIAAAAGCAPMTLYGYFHSKNEILRYIWQGFFAELFERLAAAASRGDAASRLRHACASYLDYWIEFPDRYRMVYLNQDRTRAGEHYFAEASEVLDGYALFRTLIEAAQVEGTAWPGDGQQMGETLVCGLQGIAHALITIPEYPWSPPDRLLEPLLRVVLRPDTAGQASSSERRLAKSPHAP